MGRHHCVSLFNLSWIIGNTGREGVCAGKLLRLREDWRLFFFSNFIHKMSSGLLMASVSLRLYWISVLSEGDDLSSLGWLMAIVGGACVCVCGGETRGAQQHVTFLRCAQWNSWSLLTEFSQATWSTSMSCLCETCRHGYRKHSITGTDFPQTLVLWPIVAKRQESSLPDWRMEAWRQLISTFLVEAIIQFP